MQITINTDTDDLPAVIRMLQALAPPRKLRVTNTSMGETIAELTPSTVKITNDPIDITDDEPDVHCDAPSHGDCSDQGCPAHYATEPTPEQVFAAPKSLFDSVPDVAAAGRAMAAELAKGPSATVSDVTVDAAGLPWDARIHSGAKSKLANGNWKLLRGVDPALVASVEAELRGNPQPAAAPSAPPPPVTAPATSTPAPVAPSAPPTPPAPKPITNAAELVAAVMDKRFTTDQVNAACQAVGIDNVASLLAKQDKLPEVLRELGI